MGRSTFTFQPGEQRMDAEQLAAIRAHPRALQGGDFDRARRQQQLCWTRCGPRCSARAASSISLRKLSGALAANCRDNYRTNLALNDVLGAGPADGRISNARTFATGWWTIYTYRRDSARHRRTGAVSLISTRHPRPHTCNTFYHADAGDPDGDSRHAPPKPKPRPGITFTMAPTLPGLAGATREWLLAKGVLRQRGSTTM